MFPNIIRKKRTGLLGRLRDQVEDEAHTAGQGIFFRDCGELRLKRGMDGDEDAAAKMVVVAGRRGRRGVGGEGERREDVEEELGGGRRGGGRRRAAAWIGGRGGDGNAEGISEFCESVRGEGRLGEGPGVDGDIGLGHETDRKSGEEQGRVRRSTSFFPPPSFSRLSFCLSPPPLSLFAMDQHPMQDDSSIPPPTYGFYPTEQDPSSYNMSAYNGHMPYHVVHPNPPQRVFLSFSLTRARDLIVFSFIQASSSSSQTCSQQGCIHTPTFL